MDGIKFQYELGIVVYFWRDQKAYEGQILQRNFSDMHFPHRRGYRITYQVYSQRPALIQFFNETDFGDTVFTDMAALAAKYPLAIK